MTAAAQSAPRARERGALPGWLAATGHRVFRFRDLLFPVVLGGAVLGIRPVLAGGDASRDLVVDAIGLGVALSGQLLRALVIGLAYIKRGGKNRRVYAKALVQEGLFAHSRNPLYVGNGLVIAGLAIIHGSPLLIGIVVPAFCFAYLAIVAAEEEYLLERFGEEYERYRARVPRFVPSLRGLGRTVRGMSFDWRKVVRSEYGSTASWTATAALLFLWEIVRSPGWDGSYARAAVVAPALALIALSWAVARALKKSGRLESPTSAG